MALSAEEKLSMTKALCGGGDDVTDDIITAYLGLAMGRILALRNPFSADPSGEAWESRYDTLQCEFAAEMFDRRGAEGEVSHAENGISRTYGTDGVSASLVGRVVPKGRPVR